MSLSTSVRDAAGVTLQLGKPGFTNGTTSTYSIGTAFNYAIKGKAYNKGTATNAATPTTDGNTGAAATIPAGSSTACYGSVFVWGVNSSGTVSAYQGTVERTTIAADGANATFLVAPQFPSIPDGICPFAYSVVKVGSSGAAFTLGTTSLASGSNISVAHQDIVALPAAPQVS